jgi:hypothetical protein
MERLHNVPYSNQCNKSVQITRGFFVKRIILPAILIELDAHSSLTADTIATKLESALFDW